MEEQHILEYLKLEWADIHHSRQQEWQALGIIAGIVGAMFVIASPDARFFLGLFGILGSFLGACISWQHHTIFLDKISLISKLERQLGIQYPMRKVLFPVQILLFLLFGGITSAFLGITLGYLAELLGYGSLQSFAYLAGVACFCLFVGYALVHRLKVVRNKAYGFKHPFYAEMEELERCLAVLEKQSFSKRTSSFWRTFPWLARILRRKDSASQSTSQPSSRTSGSVPLKLIAGELFNRPGIKEVSWELPNWTFESKNDEIIKPVLLNQRDVFQFSLADASSRQDCHRHNDVFEIFVSEAPMDVVYYEEQGAKNGEKTLRVERGFFIVPPGISHKVKLSGSAFVFQVTLAGRNLGEDKVLIEEL